jgi:hypothetical protein
LGRGSLRVINRITQACIGAGAYTISVGSMNPAVVLGRLLDALAVLDPGAHRALVEPGGAYASIPPEMLRDALNPWWETPAAADIMDVIVAALNASAPVGFCCVYSEGDRVELARYDDPRRAREPAQPPASTRRSTVRTRVLTPEA